jgi:parallel beta-helix repeat protein
MSASLDRRITNLLIVLVLVVGFCVALMHAAPKAHAAGTSSAPNDSSIVTICADGTVTMPSGYSSPATCVHMVDALTAYAGSNGNTTWRLLPGEHCPFSVPHMHGDLNIVGIPWNATVPGGLSAFSGTEVQSVTITPNASGSCTAQPDNAVLDVPSIESQYDHLRIRNLTIDGHNEAQYGYYAAQADFALRDVLIENNTIGAELAGSSSGGEGAEIDNSAIVKNGTGVYNVGDGSINNTLIADNTSVGIYDTEHSTAIDALELTNDTITDNNAGISLYNSDGPEIANTILAGNHHGGSASSNDCADHGSAVGWWAPVNGKSKSNLFGQSCSILDEPDSVQLPDGSDTVGAVNYSGFEPFVWALSSLQITTVSGWCSAFDQAEQARNGNCPVGALSATGPSGPIGAGPSVSDLVSYPTAATFDATIGQADPNAVQISNKRDGYITASGASVTGPFTITQDSCTWSMMLNVLGYNGCIVTVSVTPSQATDYTGTLTIHTSAGDVNVPLTAHGVYLPPSAPQSVSLTRSGASSLALAWSPPSDLGSGTSISKYTALLRNVTTGAVAALRSVDGSSTNTNFSGLVAGNSYIATIWATNNVTDSPGAAHSAGSVLLTALAPTTKQLNDNEGSLVGSTDDAALTLNANGSGPVYLGEFSGAPVGAGTDGASYYSLTTGSTQSGTLTICGVPSGGFIKFFDMGLSAWVTVLGAASTDVDGCIDISLGNTNGGQDAFATGNYDTTLFEIAPAGTSHDPEPVAVLPLLQGATPVIQDANADGPVVGDTLTVTTGSWPAGTALSYAWFHVGSPVPIGSDPTLLLGTSDENKQITVTVTGSLPGKQDAGYDSDVVGPVGAGAPPVVAGTPTISDTHPYVGEALTASAGAGWSEGANVTFQWYVVGTNQPVASGATFAVTAPYWKSALYVRATGQVDGMIPTTAQSATTSAVAPGTQALTPTPTLSGTAVVGSTLTAVPGTWDQGAVLSYQWFVNGHSLTAGPGQNPQLKLDASMVGAAVKVAMTGEKYGFGTVVKQSDAKTVAALTLTVGKVSITGTAKVGKTLLAHHGTWTAGTHFAYKWSANGHAIATATSSSLKLTSAVKGKKITVTVTGTLAGYTKATKTSAATAAVKKK